MTTTRAAKYLNASDLGKTITGTNLNAQPFAGILTKIETIGTSAISITVRQGFYGEEHRVAHDTNVAITGTPTPKGLDLHQPVTNQPQGEDWRRQGITVKFGEPNECGHLGGQGIGAGHTCFCIRPAGHPLHHVRPHGCGCGALWADTK